MQNLIDRDALLDELRWLRDAVNATSKGDVDEMIERVERQPAVDAVPVVHGAWINKSHGFWEVAECSECGVHYPTVGTGLNFCPNCGATMYLSLVSDSSDNGGAK